MNTEVVSTESTEDSEDSAIAVDGSENVHVIWEDETDHNGCGGDIDIFYKRWNATTGAWTTTEVISTRSTSNSYQPSIAVDKAGNAHVVWYDNTDDLDGSGSDADIFYRRWNATTGAWIPLEVVSTESTSGSSLPVIAVDGAGHAHVAWKDATDINGCGSDADVFYKRWNATTGAWTATEVVSVASTGNSDVPVIAVDEAGHVHVAWQDWTDDLGESGSDADVFYKRWNATTGMWMPLEVISTESTNYSWDPALAVDKARHIHIVWEDYSAYDGSGADWDVFYKRWNITNGAWTATEVVSTECTGDSTSPAIDIDGAGNAHVAWNDRTAYCGCGIDVDIFYKCWNVTTGMWMSLEIVSSESEGDSYKPALAIDGAREVYIAWEDWGYNGGSGGDHDIFFKVSRRQSTWWTWTKTDLVSTESTSGSYEPAIAIDGTGQIHMVWRDYTDYQGCGSDPDIFYKRWNVTTGVWTPTLVVSTESTSYSYDPVIAVDGAGNVHVAWVDETIYGGSGGIDPDIFYKRWNATTGAWTPTTVVSTESSDVSNDPVIAINGAGDVYVVWGDWTSYAGCGTDLDVFYKQWNATTGAWMTTAVISTESTGASGSPAIALDGAGNLHVVWEDTTDLGGNGLDNDVFYKQLNATTGAWTTAEVLSTEPTFQHCTSPVIIVDGSKHVHVAWVKKTDYGGSGSDRDLFYRRWNATTGAWTTIEVISTESTEDCDGAAIAVDIAGHIHLVWGDATDFQGSGTDQDLFYRRWNATTGAWTTTEVVSKESTEDCDEVVIAVDGARHLHVAWDEETDYDESGVDYDVFYKSFRRVPVLPTELAQISPDLDPDGIIILDWNDVPGAENYTVYRYTSAITTENLGSAEVIADQIISSTHIDAGRPEGTWWYAVVVRNLAGMSQLSNTESVTVDLPGPDTPVLASITPNPDLDGNIALEWPDTTGATSYSIYRHTSPITVINGTVTLLALELHTSQFQDVVTSGSWWYVVVAVNQTGQALSNTKSVIVQIAAVPPTFSLAPPQSSSTGNITLDWDDPPAGQTYSWTVYRHESPITTLNETVTNLGTTTSSQYADVGRPAGTWYYVIVAINATGQSIPSTCIAVEVLDGSTTGTTTGPTGSTTGSTGSTGSTTGNNSPTGGGGNNEYSWWIVLVIGGVILIVTGIVISKRNKGTRGSAQSFYPAKQTHAPPAKRQNSPHVPPPPRPVSQAGSPSPLQHPPQSPPVPKLVKTPPPPAPSPQATVEPEPSRQELRAKIMHRYGRIKALIEANDLEAASEEIRKAQIYARGNGFPALADQFAQLDAQLATKRKERENLATLERLIRVSDSVEIARVAQILNLTEDELWKHHLLDWAERFNFRIAGNEIHIDRSEAKEDFIEELKAEFATWGTDEASPTDAIDRQFAEWDFNLQRGAGKKK